MLSSKIKYASVVQWIRHDPSNVIIPVRFWAEAHRYHPSSKLGWYNILCYTYIMPQKICNFCKKEYHAKRSVQKYCSTKCQTDSLVQVPILHTCKREGCENTFNVGHQKNPKQFCCSSCAATVNNTLAPKRKPEGSCKTCGEAIASSLAFCVECREDKTKLQNLTKKEFKTLLDIACLECDKEFHQKTINQKFCSAT